MRPQVKKLRNLVWNDRMKRYTVGRTKLNERLPKMETVLNAERTTAANWESASSINQRLKRLCILQRTVSWFIATVMGSLLLLDALQLAGATAVMIELWLCNVACVKNSRSYGCLGGLRGFQQSALYCRSVDGGVVILVSGCVALATVIVAAAEMLPLLQ